MTDYEPWMDEMGRVPHGIEFESDDLLCSQHPEVWLDPAEIEKIKDEDAEARKKKELSTKQKKEAKAKKKQQKDEKKGIAAMKNRPQADEAAQVDEVTQIATSMLATDGGGFDVNGDDDFEFDLDLADEEMNFDDINL